ncbi:MAG: hypothetical protein KJ578_15430 [Bacteroidetes bacterium]|nr:hypothetical protein [Bacteroidota bacterium]
MKYLYRITGRKLFKSRIFWMMILLYVISITSLLFGIEAFINKVASNANKNSPVPIPEFSLYTFPYIWQNLSFLSGFLKLLPALILIVFVSAEYSYKTMRQHMMNGLSRLDYFFSQFIFLFGMALFSTLVLLIITLILGFQHTETITFANFFNNSFYLLAYFLELLAFFSIAFFVTSLLRRSGLSILTFSLLYVVIEPISRFYLPEAIAQNMPFKRIGNLIDVPNTSLMKLFGVNFRTYIDHFDIILSLAYSLLFLFLSYQLIKKRDL